VNHQLRCDFSEVTSLAVVLKNVCFSWFDALSMSDRMRAIGSIIATEKPHIVALQEVTSESMQMVMQAEWSRSFYVSTVGQGAWYFTLLLSVFPLEQLKRVPFDSKMGRDLLSAIISVPTSAGIRRISVGTSHLESLGPGAQRRRVQLEQSLTALDQDGTPTALFVGDMNIKEAEAADIAPSHGWFDTWLRCQSASSEKERDIGNTFDSKVNQMIRQYERERYDRVFMRCGNPPGKATADKVTRAGATSAAAASASDSSSDVSEWRVTSLERVGMAAISMQDPGSYGHNKNHKSTVQTAGFNQHVWPSDHFGLLLTLQLNERAAP
jgi:endonuclease/exonuclease/phosphatase family metal-dependent hydrolase